jgi:hypothetical protein
MQNQQSAFRGFAGVGNMCQVEALNDGGWQD